MIVDGSGDQGAHCRPLDPASLSLYSGFASVAQSVVTTRRLFPASSGPSFSGGDQLPIALVEDGLLLAGQANSRGHIAQRVVQAGVIVMLHELAHEQPGLLDR